MTRPSLDKTIEAMTEMAKTNQSPELHDLLAAAEYINFDHQSQDEYSTKKGWGKCETCNTKWPCIAWKTTEMAIVEWLIKSSTCLIETWRDR